MLEQLPEELLGDWHNVDKDSLRPQKGSKYLDRDKILQSSWLNLRNLIPDYLTPASGMSYLDVSCGNGACLEIMRHLGYSVLGIDYYQGQEWYAILLDSQRLPHTVHDCRRLPLPIPTRGFDVLTSIGAMSNYIPTGSGVAEAWLNVLDEFARIATRTIAISFNAGPNLDIARDSILSWDDPRFSLTLEREHLFRWDANDSRC